MGDELEWYAAVVADIKRSAGLPDDWGHAVGPLSAEEDAQDRPVPLLRSGMTTAELLPYGDTVRTPGGAELVVERLVSAPIRTPHGAVAALDPMSVEWQGVDLRVELRGDDQPVEAAVLRRETPAGERVTCGAAVVGRLERVADWVTMPGDLRLSIDKGCAAFVAGDRVDDLVELAGELAWPYVPDGLRPVEVDGDVIGAWVDPGDGPYGYEAMIGRNRHGMPVALLVDFHVLPR